MTERPYLTCREVADFLMAYLDGELSPEQRQEFERHLGVCPSCVRYLDSYRTTVRLAREAYSKDAPDPAAPASLVEAIRRARKV